MSEKKFMYDESIYDDGIKTAYDATEDEKGEGAESKAERELRLVRMMADECKGRFENGQPKAILSFSLSKIDPVTMAKTDIIQSTFCSAAVDINSRYNFIEFVLSFETSVHPELKVLWNYLNKYGDALNSLTPDTVEVPTLCMLFIPISALGTCYMSITDPTMCFLSASKPGGTADQIRILVEAELVNFFTDEVDLEAIDAEAQRIINQEIEYQNGIDEKNAEQEELERRRQLFIEQERKKKL